LYLLLATVVTLAKPHRRVR
jgi:hypothetical protein